MYKPHTIEQYKIQRFLDDTFAMEHFLVSPLSRTSLLLEDETGEQLAFSFLDDEVREIPLPPPAAPEEIKDFIRRFRALNLKPRLRTFEDITRWWLDHPNPLTYQQALGLSEELYRHFLSHPMIDEEDAYRLASSGLVSEDDYRDIQLWYLDGNTISHWLGPFGVDGTGNLYRLIFGYGTPAARALKFYLLDDYYCCFAQRMRKSRKKNENFTSLSYNKKKNMKKRLQRLTACKMKGPCCKKAAGVVLCKQSFSRDKKAV